MGEVPRFPLSEHTVSLRHSLHRPTRPRPIGRYRRASRAALALAAGLALFAGPLTAAKADAQVPAPSAPAGAAYAPASCYHLDPDRAGCQAFSRTNVAHHLGLSPTAAVSGLTPGDLTSAYGVPSAGSQHPTVAVVDAFNDPDIAADLAVYRKQFGLPACTTGNGCLQILNQNLQSAPLPAAPSAADDWSPETSLDIEMVSAVCPNCHITLVEADSDRNTDLFAAVQRAAGAYTFVSNSWGGPETSTETGVDAGFNHPGHVIDFASGDAGNQVLYPAASRYVLAVGGTSLNRDSGAARGWQESAWGSTGSGCSQFEPQPSWQSAVSTLAAVCSQRAISDVSAVADPNTGVAEYDSFGSNGGWSVYGGTSVATPIVTALWAMAGAPPANQTAAAYPYAYPGRFHDITSGIDGVCGNALCVAGIGWDGPTGLGSPDGPGSFAPGTASPRSDDVAVQTPSVQFGVVGTPLRPLTLTATDSRGLATEFTAADLPPGLTVDAAGTVSGIPTKAGLYKADITATDEEGGHGSSQLTFVVFKF